MVRDSFLPVELSRMSAISRIFMNSLWRLFPEPSRAYVDCGTLCRMNTPVRQCLVWALCVASYTAFVWDALCLTWWTWWCYT